VSGVCVHRRGEGRPKLAVVVAEMCRVLEVSRSGFYDWEARTPSQRHLTDRLLAGEIEAIWETSARTYGWRRVHAWLRRQGFRVAGKRVARIMRERGWSGQIGRVRVRTTRRDTAAAPAPDLVARAFNPDAPDQLWAGDVSGLPPRTEPSSTHHPSLGDPTSAALAHRDR
jgi:putative transposase